MLRFTRIILTIAIAALAVLVVRPSMAATLNEMAPFDNIIPNPCNGDPTEFAGQAHVEASITTDAAGIHTRVHLNVENAVATDTVTGVVCRETENINQSGLNVIFSLPPGSPGTPTSELPQTSTFEITANQSCPGGGGFTFKLLFHITVNPDGTFTAVVENPGEIMCR